ncbi:hypothetical protein DPMN_179116 [Dreissena polymorpha]|uniref:Uncharacterized protein n=1 Tax=Dreissena polymorpha TaxID=45954 RepID=A0A9D4EDF3_DREPO|nr:hypothetical protein DPMN_179116 [Dreissena polymorpha]
MCVDRWTKTVKSVSRVPVFPVKLCSQPTESPFTRETSCIWHRKCSLATSTNRQPTSMRSDFL